MLKNTLLAATFVVLAMGAPAVAGWDETLDWDGTAWIQPDAFEGDGLPHWSVAQGSPEPDGWTLSGSTYFQANTLLGNPAPTGDDPGFMTATGNANASFNKTHGLTKAGGWTFMIRVAAHPTATAQPLYEILRFRDGAGGSQIALGLDVKNAKVRLWDRWNNTPIDDTTLTLSDGSAPAEFHDYRLVRQPGSSTVELYIDEQTEIAAQITPGSVTGSIQKTELIAWSNFEASYDFWGYHAGATGPTPAPAPATLALLGLGALSLLRRRGRG
jgi:hypothetical protein